MYHVPVDHDVTSCLAMYYTIMCDWGSHPVLRIGPREYHNISYVRVIIFFVLMTPYRSNVLDRKIFRAHNRAYEKFLTTINFPNYSIIILTVVALG